MYLIAIAWLYVSLMMAAAEAMHPQGTILGAIFTFLLYGALPLSIVMYLMGTPMRRRARHLQEQAERAKTQELDADQAETRATAGKSETSAHDLPHKES
jgi:mannose/fructose/N-acetylgalactosamine-specific phosphotransferase system component IID